MATTRRKKVTGAPPPALSRAFPEIGHLELAERNTKIYGEEVNLERSVPDFRDGFKPVMRRILLSLKDIAGVRNPKAIFKTAKVSGHCVGTYHPHGDLSTNEAISTIVNMAVPAFEGIGNWGTLTDRAAAARYTNIKFAHFGRTFFHPDYEPLSPTSNNYDNTRKEPIVLTSLLPNILLQGTSGIGVGISTSIPAFTLRSLLQVMIRRLEGEKLQPADYARSLKFYCEYGGEISKTKENFQRAKDLFSSTGGIIKWISPLQLDEEKKTITVNKFAPRINPIPILDDKVKKIANVKMVYAGKGLSWVIQVDPRCNMDEYDEVVRKVHALFSASIKYDIYVTERILVDADTGKYKVNFYHVSIPELITMWLKWRVRLEHDSLQLQLRNAQARQDLLNLLILATDNLKIIFDAIRTSAPADYISKHLDITIDQANIILDRKVRSLSKMDQSKLKEERTAVKQHISGLKIKLKDPRKEVVEYFTSILEDGAIEQYEKFTGTRQFKLNKNPLASTVSSSDTEE
jgi:DNA gyrase/topoisomerase IV subunit A